MQSEQGQSGAAERVESRIEAVLDRLITVARWLAVAALGCTAVVLALTPPLPGSAEAWKLVVAGICGGLLGLLAVGVAR